MEEKANTPPTVLEAIWSSQADSYSFASECERRLNALLGKLKQLDPEPPEECGKLSNETPPLLLRLQNETDKMNSVLSRISGKIVQLEELI